jgi:retinol dehydrogenase-12
MADADETMSGKTCLVTGATSGIGAVTARVLAERGATVVVVGRSRERAEATVAGIREGTGNPSVEPMLADLSSQASIRQLAREIQERYPRLDVLVNNAGGLFTRSQTSVDGIEMTFALNHLGYFLLTNLLLDTLKRSAPSRIINVSSDAHKMAKSFDFDAVEKPGRHRGLQAYAQSKLANLLFTYELARRLQGTGVTVNALHPGVVATNFAANNGLVWRAIRPVLDLFSISAEEGALTTAYLATSPEVEGITGQYFVKQKSVPSTEPSLDEATARRLWSLSERLIGQPSTV